MILALPRLNPSARAIFLAVFAITPTTPAVDLFHIEERGTGARCCVSVNSALADASPLALRRLAGPAFTAVSDSVCPSRVVQLTREGLPLAGNCQQHQREQTCRLPIRCAARTAQRVTARAMFE